MKNERSTSVAVARSTRRRRHKDARDLLVNGEESIHFISFWASVILMEDHPMRSLMKVLIEKKERIDFRTAALLYHANCGKLIGK